MLALVLALGTLHGVVMRGPTQPVCQVGQPCKAPAARTCLLFGRTKVTTDAHGRYTVRLRAGTYTVKTCVPTTIGRGVTPSTVRVRASVDRRVDFFIDTGIR